MTRAPGKKLGLLSSILDGGSEFLHWLGNLIDMAAAARLWPMNGSR